MKNIKVTRSPGKTLILSPTGSALDMPRHVVDSWLSAVLLNYRNENLKATLDTQFGIASDIDEKANSYRASMNPVAQLVYDALFWKIGYNLTADIDKSLDFFFEFDRLRPGLNAAEILPTKIKYSLKKHRDDQSLLLMTIYGDPHQELGDEVARVCVAALTKAIKREKGKSIHWLGNRQGLFPAPSYPSHQTWFVKDAFVDFVCNRNHSLEEVKAMLPVVRGAQTYFNSIAID